MYGMHSTTYNELYKHAVKLKQKLELMGIIYTSNDDKSQTVIIQKVHFDYSLIK